jgi:hypothetical protein
MKNNEKLKLAKGSFERILKLLKVIPATNESENIRGIAEFTLKTLKDDTR